jgi:predicted nucleic acid-binding protein
VIALMTHAFVDTSAWFAYVNRLDANHTRIRRVLQTFQGPLVTSNFSFDETVILCLYRLGYRVAAMVGEVLFDPAVADLLCAHPRERGH